MSTAKGGSFEDAADAPNYTRALRRLRIESGLTQEQVAAYLGASRSSYIRYERGRMDLPARHLIQLCELYDVSSDDVLGITVLASARTSAQQSGGCTDEFAKTFLQEYSAHAADKPSRASNVRGKA